MLFVPAHIEKFVARAYTRGADAYILDLEDSVPLEKKADARKMLAVGTKQVAKTGAAALIRINAGPDHACADMKAACLAEVSAIVMPKVKSAAQVISVASQLDSLETQRGIAPGSIRLISQIEHVDALPHLDEIAHSSPRLLGMILGSEDFSASAGMEACPATLFQPNQDIVFACRRAGISPFGFPASIAEYGDAAVLRQHIRLARRMGFAGAFCIHPSQIAVLNEEFSPSRAEIETALGIIAAFEAGARDGRGAVAYRGKLIDLPVVQRAKETLRHARSEIK
jgi:citrate lyase subunit beta/citryl-CoA lyase